MLPTVISIFIGNFLIGLLFKPALDHLREVREELLRVSFPMPDPLRELFALKRLDPQAVEGQQASARKTINEIFRRYGLAYSSFARIGRVFLVALLLLASAAVWSFQLSLTWALACHAAAILIVFVVAFYLSRDSYPSLRELMTLDHFLNHYSNFHPDVAIDLMQIRVQLVKERDIPPYLALSNGIHLTGYKFFVALTNEDQTKCHLVVLGKVSRKSEATHIIEPDSYTWLIRLCDIDRNWPQSLDESVFLHLFVFLPLPAGWKSESITPYVHSIPLWLRGPNETWEEHLTHTRCSSEVRDQFIKFVCEKRIGSETWKIQSIDAENGLDNWRLRKLIRFYKRELEHARSIEVYQRPRHPRLGLA